MKKWGTIQEAVDYYGVATKTIHSWRRSGKLESRYAPTGKRIGYEYILDPQLKEFAKLSRMHDGRWGK